MTGAAGAHHQIDWKIADLEIGYVTPAKTLAMMAVDLLSEDGIKAREILADHQPAITKEEYLDRQTAVFQTETYDPEA